MKLDVNEVYHNHITRIIVFGLFLYKRQFRQPNVYRQSVYTYVNKRLPWKVNLKIETVEEWSNKDLIRDLLLDEILEDKKTEYIYHVAVSFTTPLKDVLMDIDLSDETKYEKFLYS